MAPQSRVERRNTVCRVILAVGVLVIERANAARHQGQLSLPPIPVPVNLVDSIILKIVHFESHRLVVGCGMKRRPIHRGQSNFALFAIDGPHEARITLERLAATEAQRHCSTLSCTNSPIQSSIHDDEIGNIGSDRVNHFSIRIHELGFWSLQLELGSRVLQVSQDMLQAVKDYTLSGHQYSSDFKRRLTMSESNGEYIAADRAVRKVRQPSSNRFTTLGAAKGTRITAEDLADAATFQHLLELHHDGSKAALVADKSVRAVAGRRLCKLLRVPGILRQRPLDECALARANAWQSRFVVRVDTGCANDQVDIRILGEVIGVAVCLCVWRQGEYLDGILGRFDSAV